MLKRKMLRDIKNNLSQFITIFLMIAIGVMAFTGIEAYMVGMQETADNFYESNNLQDLNVIGANFSKDDLEKIKNIENVNNAERKLSITATTDDEKTLLLNFIESNEISQFYIMQGEKFNKDKSGIWVDNFYAEKNNLKLNDEIRIKYDGYNFTERIVGMINVPDHIYDVKDESELYPDHSKFGFAYISVNEIEGYLKYKTAKELNVSEETLEEMDFNYEDYLVFNYVMVDVNQKENVEKVKDEIEKQIENAKAIIRIEDTSSYSTYQGEIDEGKTYIGVFSGLFIFIAMLSVVTTMTRVVKNQRVQIGTLKALGFKDKKIIKHYIDYGVWIAILAAIVGMVLGYHGIGNIFINMEMSFFEVPNGKPVMKFSALICAILVVICVAFVTYITCRKYLKEKPAETLRPEMPTIKKGSLNITTKGIFKKVGFSTKWNVRDMLRNKIRTITGIVGITGCCMLIVCALGMLDSMNHFVKLQFEDLYNFEYKLSIKDDIKEERVNEIEEEYGNATSMSYLIEIKDKEGNKTSNNIFITDAGECVRFVNKKDTFIKLDNNEGVYITFKLADTLGIGVGDTIIWHLVGNSNYYESKIVGFNKDPQNQNMTMTRAYFECLDGTEYKPDSLYTNKDLSGVKEIEGIELIQNLNNLKDGMNNMLSTMKTMIVLIIGIAILLGAVIIYNMGILSYTEKQYQFATLKVLGFNDDKIKKIFIKQNNIISIISIILGMPLGYYLTDWLFKTAIDEKYDFGASINIQTYIMAAVGTFLISYIVSKILSKKISSIDMVSSLKGNE